MKRQRNWLVALAACLLFITSSVYGADPPDGQPNCLWAYRLTSACVSSGQGNWAQCQARLARTVPQLQPCLDQAEPSSGPGPGEVAVAPQLAKSQAAASAPQLALASDTECKRATELVEACVADQQGSEAQCQQWQIRRLPELAACFGNHNNAATAQPASLTAADSATPAPAAPAQLGELPPAPAPPIERQVAKDKMRLVLPPVPQLAPYVAQVAAERDIISENDSDLCDDVGAMPGHAPEQGPYQDPGDVCSALIIIEDLRDQDPRFAKMKQYFTDTRTYLLGCDPVVPPIKAGDPPSALANLREGEPYDRAADGTPVFVFPTTGIPYDTCQFRLLTVAFVGDKTTGHLGAALWHPIPTEYLPTEIVEPGKMNENSGWNFDDGKPAYHFGRTPVVHVAPPPPPLPPVVEPPPPPPCNCTPLDWEFWPLEFGSPLGHYGDAAAE